MSRKKKFHQVNVTEGCYTKLRILSETSGYPMALIIDMFFRYHYNEMCDRFLLLSKKREESNLALLGEQQSTPIDIPKIVTDVGLDEMDKA